MDKNIQDKIEEAQETINEMQSKLEELKRVAEKRSAPHFDKRKRDAYFFISTCGVTLSAVDEGLISTQNRYAAANYCHNQELMKKRAAEETLSRLIWREAEIANARLEGSLTYNFLYTIYYSPKNKKFKTLVLTPGEAPIPGAEAFLSVQDANTCIKNVVIPFAKSHPELGWELAEEEES